MKDASVSEHRYVIVFSHTRTPWCTRVQVHLCVVISKCVIVSFCKCLIFESINLESCFSLLFSVWVMMTCVTCVSRCFYRRSRVLAADWCSPGMPGSHTPIRHGAAPVWTIRLEISGACLLNILLHDIIAVLWLKWCAHVFHSQC